MIHNQDFVKFRANYSDSPEKLEFISPAVGYRQPFYSGNLNEELVLVIQSETDPTRKAIVRAKLDGAYFVISRKETLWSFLPPEFGEVLVTNAPVADFSQPEPIARAIHSRMYPGGQVQFLDPFGEAFANIDHVEIDNYVGNQSRFVVVEGVMACTPSSGGSSVIVSKLYALVDTVNLTVVNSSNTSLTDTFAAGPFNYSFSVTAFRRLYLTMSTSVTGALVDVSGYLRLTGLGLEAPYLGS